MAVALAVACGESSDDGGGSHTGGTTHSGGTYSGGSGGAGTSAGGSGGTPSGGNGGSPSGGTNSGGTPSGGTNAGGAAGNGASAGAGGASGGAGGASGAGALGGTGGGKFYSTSFSGTENPISEGGLWTNGGLVGLDWQDVQKNPGLAFGTGFSAGYDDCLAHLSGFSPNHFAEATVHVASGFSPPSSQEIELLVRFEITAHSARGYEINNGWDGAYSQIVRWNGPLDSFDYLPTTGSGFGPLAEGDVIRATAVGDTITVYKNGAQVMQATDATWSDGNPGMAMFVRPGAGAQLDTYGFTSFSAGDL